MFEAIIVMAPDETAQQITSFLHSYRPALNVLHVTSDDVLLSLSPDFLATARLIAFTSPIIVPSQVLRALGYGAYNFHPAPPTYPGLCPAQYALYEGAEIYGATAHVMLDKVDCGPIVGVELFRVEKDATVFDIELQSFTLLVRIFKELGQHLATNPAGLPAMPVIWGETKSTRRWLQRMCDIPADIEHEELDRRVKAFANNHFGIQPTITLHGYTFRLVHEGPAPAVGPDTVANAIANREANAIPRSALIAAAATGAASAAIATP